MSPSGGKGMLCGCGLPRAADTFIWGLCFGGHMLDSPLAFLLFRETKKVRGLISFLSSLCLGLRSLRNRAKMGPSLQTLP